MDWNELGIHIDNIFIPSEKVDLKKWSVVACDQYSSEPEYWNRVSDYVSDAPSTLKMIVPEAFLNDVSDEVIENIHSTMADYIDNGFLNKLDKGVILVERTIGDQIRKGVVLALDLEKYDYSQGSQALIRATEGTIADRIPPRLKVRAGGRLECPHILMLIDDPEYSTIEPLQDIKRETVYDFELMENGGKIKGSFIEEEKLEGFKAALTKLYTSSQKRYKSPFLVAAGDGNHSLACAKAGWDKIKIGLTQQQRENHPARFALCELVNLHDKALNFEPIHRVLFNAKDNFIGELLDILKKQNQNAKALDEDFKTAQDNSEQKITLMQNNEYKYIKVKGPSARLVIATVQNAINEYLDNNKESYVDYIHGCDSVANLAKNNNIGFLLEPIDKYGLFDSIVNDGVLPRKAFSLGEAFQKRFYFECREIV